MLPVVPYWIDWTAPWVVYAFALLKGSAPERIVAGVGSVALFHSVFLQPHRAGEMLPTETVKDAVEFIVIAALAMRYDRWWLLVAGMMTLLKVATDAVGMIVRLHWWTFGTAIWTCAYIYLAALAAGTWRSWRERLARAAAQSHPSVARDRSAHAQTL